MSINDIKMLSELENSLTHSVREQQYRLIMADIFQFLRPFSMSDALSGADNDCIIQKRRQRGSNTARGLRFVGARDAAICWMMNRAFPSNSPWGQPFVRRAATQYFAPPNVRVRPRTKSSLPATPLLLWSAKRPNHFHCLSCQVHHANWRCLRFLFPFSLRYCLSCASQKRWIAFSLNATNRLLMELAFALECCVWFGGQEYFRGSLLFFLFFCKWWSTISNSSSYFIQIIIWGFRGLSRLVRSSCLWIGFVRAWRFC